MLFWEYLAIRVSLCIQIKSKAFSYLQNRVFDDRTVLFLHICCQLDVLRDNAGNLKLDSNSIVALLDCLFVNRSRFWSHKMDVGTVCTVTNVTSIFIKAPQDTNHISKRKVYIMGSFLILWSPGWPQLNFFLVRYTLTHSNILKPFFIPSFFFQTALFLLC